MLSRREFTVSILGAAAAATQLAPAATAQTGGRPSPARAGGGPDAFAGLTLAEASAQLQAGTVPSGDLVNACGERIDVYNQKLDAFIPRTPEPGHAEARTLDMVRRAGRRTTL